MIETINVLSGMTSLDTYQTQYCNLMQLFNDKRKIVREKYFSFNTTYLSTFDSFTRYNNSNNYNNNNTMASYTCECFYDNSIQ